MSLTNAGLGLSLCLVAAGAVLLPADEAATRAVLETFKSEFVAITPGEGKFPGEFVMGTPRGPYSEEPARVVKLRSAFSIAKYEVPQNLYEAVMGSNPSKWKGPRNSAENFSFEDAQAFCRKATTLMRAAKLIADDEVIRLPTEAEWEYCCRAGTTTPYSFGETATGPKDTGNLATVLDLYGWHTGNAAGNDPAVGVLKPNPWGLYDVHGYLWEYVSDTWHETYDMAPPDGSSWDSREPQDLHVVRGGSWKERYECHRSAYRRPIGAKDVSDAVGLRCVLAKVRS